MYLKLRLNLRNFEVIILVSNIICFESKTLLMYQNSTNWLGSDENLPMENLSDKILKILFIRYVTLKLRVLRETGPRTAMSLLIALGSYCGCCEHILNIINMQSSSCYRSKAFEIVTYPRQVR